MEALFERAKQNGIAAEWIDQAALSRLEPNVTGLAALLVPSTGIVDYKKSPRHLPKSPSARGTESALGAEILAIREDTARLKSRRPKGAGARGF